MSRLHVSQDAFRAAAAALQLSSLPSAEPGAWGRDASALLQWAIPHARLSVLEGPCDAQDQPTFDPAEALRDGREGRRRDGISVRADTAPNAVSGPGWLAIHEVLRLPRGRVQVHSLWRTHRPFGAAEATLWREVVRARCAESERGDPEERPDARFSRLAERARLSRQQSAAVRHALEGCTNEEIGDRLGVSLETVKTHLAAAYAKTGLRGRRQLTAHVYAGEAAAELTLQGGES